MEDVKKRIKGYARVAGDAAADSVQNTISDAIKKKILEMAGGNAKLAAVITGLVAYHYKDQIRFSWPPGGRPGFHFMDGEPVNMTSLVNRGVGDGANRLRNYVAPRAVVAEPVVPEPVPEPLYSPPVPPGRITRAKGAIGRGVKRARDTATYLKKNAQNTAANLPQNAADLEAEMQALPSEVVDRVTQTTKDIFKNETTLQNALDAVRSDPTIQSGDGIGRLLSDENIAYMNKGMPQEGINTMDYNANSSWDLADEFADMPDLEQDVTGIGLGMEDGGIPRGPSGDNVPFRTTRPKFPMRPTLNTEPVPGPIPEPLGPTGEPTIFPPRGAVPSAGTLKEAHLYPEREGKGMGVSEEPPLPEEPVPYGGAMEGEMGDVPVVNNLDDGFYTGNSPFYGDQGVVEGGLDDFAPGAATAGEEGGMISSLEGFVAENPTLFGVGGGAMAVGGFGLTAFMNNATANDMKATRAKLLEGVKNGTVDSSVLTDYDHRITRQRMKTIITDTTQGAAAVVGGTQAVTSGALALGFEGAELAGAAAGAATAGAIVFPLTMAASATYILAEGYEEALEHVRAVSEQNRKNVNLSESRELQTRYGPMGSAWYKHLITGEDYLTPDLKQKKVDPQKMINDAFFFHAYKAETYAKKIDEKAWFDDYLEKTFLAGPRSSKTQGFAQYEKKIRAMVKMPSDGNPKKAAAILQHNKDWESGALRKRAEHFRQFRFDTFEKTNKKGKKNPFRKYGAFDIARPAQPTAHTTDPMLQPNPDKTDYRKYSANPPDPLSINSVRNKPPATPEHDWVIPGVHDKRNGRLHPPPFVSGHTNDQSNNQNDRNDRLGTTSSDTLTSSTVETGTGSNNPQMHKNTNVTPVPTPETVVYTNDARSHLNSQHNHAFGVHSGERGDADVEVPQYAPGQTSHVDAATPAPSEMYDYSHPAHEYALRTSSGNSMAVAMAARQSYLFSTQKHQAMF